MAEKYKPIHWHKPTIKINTLYLCTQNFALKDLQALLVMRMNQVSL